MTKLRHKLTLYIAAVMMAATAVAAPIDEAKSLYQAGKYEAAVAALQALKAKMPRDGNVNYYLGASLVALERRQEAKAPLAAAEGRGVADASRLLARIAFDEYDVDAAEEHIASYRRLVAKNKKAKPSAEVEALESKLVIMRNMLDRVEKVEVIDSVVVDADDFFRYYKLSPEAGTLALRDDAASALELSFTPQDRSAIYYAAREGADEDYALVSSGVLDDGSVESPHPLAGELSEGGNAVCPFLLTDGVTLYYASDGDTSLGGYDIYMTRRGDDGFLNPQNVGMPYNSPFDDYLMAIDDVTGVGWWATDRNQIPGKVTIYIFKPSEMRVNYEPDDSDIASYARLSSIRATQPEGADYTELQARLNALGEAGAATGTTAVTATFELSLGNGRVYHRLSDFNNASARRSMSELLSWLDERRAAAQRLDAMREQYRSGNKTIAGSILSAEQQLTVMDARIVQLRNTVIRQEQYGR
ncbi:MAG: hypothetical protein ACI30W_06440 [Muribaculaceae bacterium]